MAIQAAIERREAVIGMTPEQLDQAMGLPNRINTGEYKSGSTQQRMLLDFTAKLGTTMATRSWQIPAGFADTEKVLSVIAAEIGRSHPHLKLRH